MAVKNFRLGPEPEPPVKKQKPKPPPPPPTLWEQLLPCSWRNVSFPISSMRVTLSQDIVEHKYWGVDGARVEGTGRAPMQIEAVIPFVNGIVPGKNEKWGVLYPTTFRDFLRAFNDKTAALLIHPELGSLSCKPVSLEFSHDAMRRDGVEVTARWIETVDEDVILATDPFERDSPIQEAERAAQDLDASKEDYVALSPDAPLFEESFGDLVDKLTGIVDTTALGASLALAKPGQMLFRVKRLQNSLERASNVLLWPVVEACERTKSAVHSIRGAFGPHTVQGAGLVQGEQTKRPPLRVPSGSGVASASHRPIKRFVTTATSTVSDIAGQLPRSNSIDELIRLNPFLLARPEVAEGTVIRYYAG